MSANNTSSSTSQLSIQQIIDQYAAKKDLLDSNDIKNIIDKLSVHNPKKSATGGQMMQTEIPSEQEKSARREAYIQQVTSMDLPLDWENAFSQDERVRGVHVDSVSDGLILSLNNLGKVDIEYISAVTGKDYKTVIESLKGAIYQNPETWDECFYKGWETSEEYLSGNLLRKRKAAEEANEIFDGYFTENINAINHILPPSVPAKDIYVSLGSPWIPSKMIDSFIVYLLGSWSKYWHRQCPWVSYEDFMTKHDELTGSWEIPYKSRYAHDIKANRTYGTTRINALHILENTLNMKSPTVTDEITIGTYPPKKKRVINQSETLLAIEKQNKIKREFQSWIWQDKERKKQLEDIFEEKFGCVRRRIFDGSFLTFPTLSSDITLYPYQKDAVARILFTPNTLLAHDVGAGKTYVMIAAGMELKRMRISRKNMFVVPNNIVGQWKDIFTTMYPEAKLLCIDPHNFKPTKREEILKQIRDEDFDGIIIAYSCFEHIPLSKEYYRNQLLNEKAELAAQASHKRKATSRLMNKQRSVSEALADLSVAMSKLDSDIYFDDLGITRLFVDEAHNFKNVPIDTKIDRVLGISSSGSKKCQDMMDKVRLVQTRNNGAGVVFATGTPITNSITDAFVMQKYLQSGELALLDLQSFDSWIGMFAERRTEFEIDVDTSNYRLATRFSKFHNLPELTNMLSAIADFHQVDSPDGIPKFDGYTDVLIPKTSEFSDYLVSLSRRADDVRKGLIERTEDNMLKITTDGRWAALDLRLVLPFAPFTHQSKVMRCVEIASDIYYKTAIRKSTQIIFCDSSTPKPGFNIYDELKSNLISNGIPENEIAYIHDARTEAKRSALFAKVRSGEIRILIGSTAMLGLGVNIQDRLIALHHLDIPWRPADMTQREGRILRQGNTNPDVQIFRYITEGSFDAYSWQLLEIKQRFINDLLSGSMTDRSGSDIDDTVLSYAEVKALAIGNPLVKKRVETANELSRYATLQHKLVEAKLQMKAELLELPALITSQEKMINDCVADMNYYTEWKTHNPAATDTKGKKAESDKRKMLREQLHTSVIEHTLAVKERYLMDYRGFKIILPSNMRREDPYIWLKHIGRYRIELGDTDVGNLIRIDNFLEDMHGYLDRLKNTLIQFQQRSELLKAELDKDEGFTDAIEECRSRLADIDRQLGVDKNG